MGVGWGERAPRQHPTLFVTQSFPRERERERERERARSLEDDIKVWEKNKKTTVLVIDGGRLQLSGLCEA